VQIKGFEDGIVANRAQSGHIKGAAQRPASAGNVPAALDRATVAVVRGHACPGRSGGVAELPEFRHFGQHGGSGDRADAWNGVQPGRLGFKCFIRRDEFGNGGVTGRDLLFQQPEQLFGLPCAALVLVVLGAVGLDEAAVNELTAVQSRFRQTGLPAGGGDGGGGLEGAAIVAEDGGIEGSVLARCPLALAKWRTRPASIMLTGWWAAWRARTTGCS